MTTYTRNVKDDQTATYDCGLCGHYSVDVDGARAHHAEHVAGPKLKEAVERIRAAIVLDSDVMVKLAAVLASQTYSELFAVKAEPKG